MAVAGQLYFLLYWNNYGVPVKVTWDMQGWMTWLAWCWYLEWSPWTCHITFTWGMCVPFKVCVEQFQCLRCEWCPAFPLLWGLNTNEFSEVVLPTLISETRPACNFIRCTKMRKSGCSAMECIHILLPFCITVYSRKTCAILKKRQKIGVCGLFVLKHW
jgi:hypothetical protein